jgi:transcriptional regulator with XRE-family HTH domain
MTDAPDTLGARLRAARQDAGLTMASASRVLGVHLQTLWRWEVGRQEPPAGIVVRLAKLYGVTTDALLGP